MYCETYSMFLNGRMVVARSEEREAASGQREAARGGYGRRGAGFSFIEVMVVVVIIGLLAGAVAMRVTGYVEKAKEVRVRSDISTIVTAIEAYHLTNSQYPGNEDGLDHLSLKTKLDPWGRPYQYNSPGPRDEPFEVMTFGADGREGGEGENADVYSWRLEPEAAK